MARFDRLTWVGIAVIVALLLALTLWGAVYDPPAPEPVAGEPDTAQPY